MADEKDDVEDFRWLARSASEARGHALHGEEVLGHGHGESQVRELREIARGGLVPRRDITFDTIVEPIGWKALLLAYAAGELADDRRGLENRVHAFC